MISGLVSIDSRTTPILREAMVLLSDGEERQERMSVCSVTTVGPTHFFLLS